MRIEKYERVKIFYKIEEYEQILSDLNNNEFEIIEEIEEASFRYIVAQKKLAEQPLELDREKAGRVLV